MVTNALYLIVVIITIHSNYATDPTSNCRRCKAGFYVKNQCNQDHDTICSPCTSGHYMSNDSNNATKCNECQVCPSGTYARFPCTNTSNTECELCETESDSESYRTSCKNTQSMELNVEGKKLDYLEENGSGEEDLTTMPPKVSNISFINDELEDGSGETILEIPSSGELVLTNNSTVAPSTTAKSVLNNLTDETDVFLPVPKPSPSQRPSTTSNIPTTSHKPSTTSTIPTTTHTRTTTTKTTTTEQPTTTARELDIGIGTGIKDDEQQQLPDEVDVIIQPLLTTTLKASTNTPLESAVSHRKSAMSDDSDKVSIGIVIAVAIIAALVFFVIGFIAAKYCRRRRNTMKLMKNQNGHHNGSVPIIVENKPYKSNGIYDEIGREQNGTCSSSNLDEIVPVHAENVYAVPNKRKKPEPSDEIKYIDETTDDETENKEGERLLAPPGDDTLQDSNVPEEAADESSPMMTEIQSELENGQEQPKETDALMEKS